MRFRRIMAAARTVPTPLEHPMADIKCGERSKPRPSFTTAASIGKAPTSIPLRQTSLAGCLRQSSILRTTPRLASIQLAPPRRDPDDFLESRAREDRGDD